MQPRGAKDSIGHHGACIEAVGDRYVYVCGNVQFRAQLDVVDVNNPDQPSIVTSLPVTGGGAIDLLYQGSLLYLPDEVGLEVFDVSNPAMPSLKGLIAFTPPTFGATSVAVSGTTAFINDGDNGLNAVDVSDPANMRILSNLPSSKGGRVSEIVYRDGFLYGTAGLPSPEFVVLDVRDPLRMARVGSVALPSVVSNDVLLDGPYAYVANGAGGVAVIDIRDPARPMRVAQISVPGFAKRLALKDDRLLVTAGEGGLVEIRQTPQAASIGGAVVSRREAVVIERELVAPHTPLRTVAATSPAVTKARSVVVTSIADSGPGTLRDALINLAAGDVITFDPAVFPPHDPATIQVATQLPHLKVSGVVIDASNAGVILDGSRLSGNFDSGFELEPPSRGNTIMGMQIVNFPSAGIFIDGDGGNVIGGDRSRGSGPTGQGNVINRNRKFGIHVGNPNDNRIVGNLIGTDATGRVALGDQEFGVDLFYQEAGTPLGGDRVGGSEPWEANVIAGNIRGEVKLHNAGGHRVIGNFIGVDVDGNRIGNCSQGVIIDASSDNIVADNVIVAQHSVWIIDPGACCNQVAGNWIGMTKDGRVIPRQIDGEGGINVNEPFNLIFGNRFGGVRYTAVLAIAQANTVAETIIAGNTFEGLSPTQSILSNAPIEVSAASRTFIGGSTASFRNVINAGKTGVRLFGGVHRTFILGNDIGDDDPLTLQNLNGIDTESSSFTFIQNNTIANTSGKGLIIGAARNRIRQNSIYGNQGGAISVDAAAEIPSPPDIGSVSLSTVAGRTCARCTVEIFSDTGTQSRWYEGSTVADADGRFTVRSLSILRGPNITATATDSAGSTSALSAAVVRPPISPRRRAVRH
ncbi:MAG TPA: right-handed parallel beta-helix repeat-containing protein [Thermoanaerobaculia bacterium]|nr:right-handed parallel beta-helix repeat-containing protein [Thermoanaerobaculia bacterium]